VIDPSTSNDSGWLTTLLQQEDVITFGVTAIGTPAALSMLTQY
jgi:hypothetical protein